MKRSLDLVISLIVTVVTLLPLVVLCALIWASDGGKPVFAQRRLGRDEVPFTLYKLRTMTIGTDEVPTHNISASQVTKLGRFLRATKLDELPQLWNVIKGDMSMVGPRPGLVGHEELTACRREFGVFKLKPGITGISQVEQIDMSNPRRLAQSDARYIGHTSVLNDLVILWKTFIGRGSGDRTGQ